MFPLLNGALLARRLTVGVGAALAAATFVSPADAAFTTGKCQGDAMQGRGASFAASAHNQVFIPNFGTVFCGAVGSAPTVTYDSQGSGAGRRVVGARTNGAPEGDNRDGSKSRNQVPRYGMSEEPLSATDQANVNKGTDAVGDEGLIRTIPIALGSVAIVVNLPDGCSIGTQANGAALTVLQQGQVSDAGTANTRRLQLGRKQLEKIFNGGSEIDTWGELVGWINDGNGTAGELTDARCAEFPIVHIRRLDDGGTTFVLKDYLNQVEPARGWSTTYTTPDTRTWPNDSRTVSFDYNNDGDSTDVIANCAAQFAPFTDNPVYTRPGGTPVPGGTCTEASVPLLQTTDVTAAAGGNGNDDLVNKVNDFDGSIGYGDLSTVRQQRSFAFERQANATDDKYWVKLQTKNEAAYADPQANATGFVGGSTNKGSSCNTAQLRNLPGGNDPTAGDWSQASGVDSTATGYGICSLTYALAFDDYGTPYSAQADQGSEERKARTVRDYIEAMTSSGQNGLFGFDYAPLSPTLQELANAAAKQIGWAKSGGNGGTPQPQPEDPKPNNPAPNNPAPNTPAPNNPPAPVAPSNAFTVGTPKNNKGNATLTVQVPGAGNVSIIAKATIGKKKNGQIASASSAAKASGPVAFTIKPSKAAVKELKKKKKLKVTLEITFTPTGGQAKTTTVTVTLKPAPVKKKSKKK